MNWFRRLMAWRWLPFLGLTLASVTFVFFTLLFTDGATASKLEQVDRKSAPGALRLDDFHRASAGRDAPAEPASARAQLGPLVSAPDVRSFFPPSPMELPPPLEEEPPVPEPQVAPNGR
jgi:hypothetical protein